MLRETTEKNERKGRKNEKVKYRIMKEKCESEEKNEWNR